MHAYMPLNKCYLLLLQGGFAQDWGTNSGEKSESQVEPGLKLGAVKPAPQPLTKVKSILSFFHIQFFLSLLVHSFNSFRVVNTCKSNWVCDLCVCAQLS